eukprot:7632673-Prorocentrum_lima.AAC.1
MVAKRTPTHGINRTRINKNILVKEMVIRSASKMEDSYLDDEEAAQEQQSHLQEEEEEQPDS